MNTHSSKCRTCLSEREVMYSLFAHIKLKSVQDPLLDSVKMLSSISIQISESDNLPKRICQQCLKMLNIAYIFQQQCKEADLWLHEHLETDFLHSSVIDEDTNEAGNLVIDEDSNEAGNLVIDEDTNEAGNLDLAVTDQTCVWDISVNTIQEANKLSHINKASGIIKEINHSRQSQICNISEAQKTHLAVTDSKCISDILVDNIIQDANQSSHNTKASVMINEVNSTQHSKISNINSGVPNLSSKTSTVQKLPYKTSNYFSFDRKHVRRRVLKLPEGFETCENDNGQEWYKCKECVKTFSSITECHAHKRSHKLFACKICQRTFHSQHGLSYHKKQHLGLKKYVCDYENCNKSFLVKQALDRHKTRHSEQKNHLCNFCGKPYNTADSLSYHLKIHLGDRPHLCMYCGKTFTEGCHLKYHLLTHTGAKPHVCNICGRRYAGTNQLKLHVSKYCSVGKVPKFRPKLRDDLITKQDKIKN